jgi:hypothetical protein
MKEDVLELKREVDAALSKVKNSRYSIRKDDNVSRYAHSELLAKISLRLKMIIDKYEIKDAITQTKA